MENGERLSATPVGDLAILDAMARQTAPIPGLGVVMGPNDANGQGGKQDREWRQAHG